jgi:hypothetical protein
LNNNKLTEHATESRQDDRCGAEAPLRYDVVETQNKQACTRSAEVERSSFDIRAKIRQYFSRAERNRMGTTSICGPAWAESISKLTRANVIYNVETTSRKTPGIEFRRFTRLEYFKLEKTDGAYHQRTGGITSNKMLQTYLCD